MYMVSAYALITDIVHSPPVVLLIERRVLRSPPAINFFVQIRIGTGMCFTNHDDIPAPEVVVIDSGYPRNTRCLT